MRKVRLVALFGLIIARHATAACDPAGLPLQTGAVPLSSGTIVFEATDTALSPSSAQLFMFDIATKTQTDFTKNWGLTSPRNPHISPDGNYVVFTAVANNRTDLFIWKNGASNVVSLTGNLPNLRYEDGTFSFDGQSIMAKRNFNIVEFPINYANPAAPMLETAKVFTTNGTGSSRYEASGPFMSPDNRYVFFWRGSSAYPPEIVHVINVASGVESAFPNTTLTSSYFPVVRDFTVEFYVGHTAHQGDNDQIFLQSASIPNSTAIQLPLNDCNGDNSDPGPVNDDYILFSNDDNAQRTYLPYLGAIAKAQVWGLTGIGLGQNASSILALGYTPYSLSPPPQ